MFHILNNRVKAEKRLDVIEFEKYEETFFIRRNMQISLLYQKSFFFIYTQNTHINVVSGSKWMENILRDL